MFWGRIHPQTPRKGEARTTEKSHEHCCDEKMVREIAPSEKKLKTKQLILFLSTC